MNNYIESGMYYYNTSIQIANRPGVIYGGLIVSNANGWIKQEVYDIMENKIFIRIRNENEGGWSDWREI